MGSMNRQRWTVVLLIVLLVGLAAGIYLVVRPQFFNDLAAVPNGPARMSIAPLTKTSQVQDLVEMEVKFDSGGQAISAVTAELEYEFVGATPPYTVQVVNPNPALSSSGWSFPVKSSTTSNNKVTIKVGGVYADSGGYSASSPTTLATIQLKAQTPGSIGIAFVASQSKVLLKSTAADILQTPSSVATYTVAGSQPTPTPVVTADITPEISLTPTLTPTPTTLLTPTPTSGLSPTPTSTLLSEQSELTQTPTMTPPDELMVAGNDAPTYLLGGSAVILILAGVVVLLW